jgi:hypothetical protein
MRTLITVAIFLTLGLMPAAVEFLAPYAWVLPLLALAAGIGMCAYQLAVNYLDRKVLDRFYAADRRFARTHQVRR